MIAKGLKSLMSTRFAREEKGTASIEAMIMVPAMFLVILTFITLIDYTRMHSQHQKAAYTISDMVSRETVPLDQDYLSGTGSLLDTLTRNQQDSGVRLTIVFYDEPSDTYRMDWSRTTGAIAPASDADVGAWGDQLPNLVHNERVIVVETTAVYRPPFDVGLGNRRIENFIFTRPRYAPQVLWEDLETEFAGS